MSSKGTSLRLTGGQWRNRKLSLAGVPDNLRPTMERTREAVFNSLMHAPWAQRPDGRALLVDGVALDACCGTGAYGLEALSRGAANVRFVDQDPVSINTVETMIRTLDISRDQAVAQRTPMEKLGQALTPMDLVFLDPPYDETHLITEGLPLLQSQGWLAAHTVCVVETAKKHAKFIETWLGDHGTLHHAKTYGTAWVGYWSV